ncbi:primosomal protein N' [Arthrobacter sp. 35W]|uniref:primosomal protein N' n=1 Tax=Arthrobacter sp. 35W TaxID=1132441 RepID=UPI0004033B48|nr:primosomal protein N' [Arthrobacter sp. 35W]
MDVEDGVQLSLLSGFVPRERTPDPHSGVVLATQLPVARVLIESSLPHLDRIFDYSVPAELDAEALPGVRVKVRFSGQELNGYLTERVAESDTARLTPLSKVFSAVPVLAPEVLALARAVAERCAGSVSDVLRVAIPPRVAKLDKEYLERLAAGGGAPEEEPATPGPSLLAGYQNGAPFLTHLAAGGSPRGVLNALQGFGPVSWHHQLAQAIAHCFASGRGAVAVVPDQRDLLLLEDAVGAVLPVGSFVRLTAEDGQNSRYGNYLRVLSGEVRVVLGTRSAAYAPVANPGLFCLWDDGDDNHVERRAPYQHSRDVLLLRAEAQGAAMLLAAHSRSTESQRLLNTGWAQPLHPERSVARQLTARVISTADSYETGLDPLARVARLPERAWSTAKEALTRGPVLVQVARTGYAPSLACQRCREIARCKVCSGPLMQSTHGSGLEPLTACRWCSTPETDFQCSTCGGHDLRRVVVGATRTAEELGKAFPQFPVISSSGDHVKASIPDKPAVVVATVGAEPLAPSGYAAALLLDGDAQMRRESLRAEEGTLRRWFNAAALVRPAREGGVVVVTADESSAVAALVRWDPAGYAERELSLRAELGLPPAVRIASITGPQSAVSSFVAALDLPDSVRTVGPAPLNGDEDYRTLLFFPFGQARQVTARLRSLKAANAAKKLPGVQVRCDGLDVL